MDRLLDTSFGTQNTLGGTVNFTEGGTPVILDNNVSISDAELNASNYNGATLTLARTSAANSEDVFSSPVFSNDFIIVDNTSIGKVTTNSAGTLVLTFSDLATQSLVNSALQQIAYSNSSNNPPASVQLDWTFNDGNTGGALSTTGNTTVNITAVNDAPILTAPNAINYTDTIFDDSFATVTGQLVASDVDGDSLTYGIDGVTNSSDSLTVSQSNDYGELIVTKATGAYNFVPNDAGIEALIDNANTRFIVTVSDGQQTVNETLSINIQSGITESLGNDSLTGTAANNQFNGLAGDDIISGLAGNDTINGGVGADRMIGDKGDDTYYVDNVGDVVKENTREGLDTVYSSVSHILAANVENLILTNTAISGTGNTLDNYLTGNIADNSLSGESGNDTIDGQGGADTMVGGKGDDSYYVDNVGDVVKESAREGVDTVYSSVNYSLTPNVENLVLIGTAVEGIGNESDNYLKGNDASNTLSGGLGSDNYDLVETTAATDTVRIVTGDSLIANYDKVSNFTLGMDSNTSDKLDLNSILIEADAEAVDGNNSGNIKSHHISNGIISFDDVNLYANSLTLNDANLAKVFGYLQANITGHDTVAFVAEGNTFVFQDGGDAADTLVELVGVTASSINTTDLGSVWIM